MTDQELDQRLKGWAEAYGGEQLRKHGYAGALAMQGACGDESAIQRGTSPADEVERIVSAMEHGGRWRESRVLRVDCFLPGLTEAERLQRLSRIGLVMSRAAYYTYAKSARSFVCGALVVTSSDLSCGVRV